jgi:hypothetical protein
MTLSDFVPLPMRPGKTGIEQRWEEDEACIYLMTPDDFINAWLIPREGGD